METTMRGPARRGLPRPAATVVLLREARDGFEVLMTTRSPDLAFMPGAAVFPGGAVTRADLDREWERASSLSRTAAAGRVPLDPEAALAAHVCAIREAFEEVGWIAGAGPVASIGRRAARHSGAFLRRCVELGVVIATDALVPAGRWITPEGAPVRFDTMFFAVKVDPSWRPEPEPSEVASCEWIGPRAALDRLATGGAVMAPPTVQMLQRLSESTSADEALESLRARGISHGGVFTATLAPEVTVVLAPNPGAMTGPGTNTYVVGTGPRCVIDPAVDDDAYVDEVLERAGSVEFVLVTHRHPDHVGGVKTIAERTGASVRAYGGAPAGGASVTPLSPGEVIEVGGARLEALHTPGHASDHLCFYVRESAGLFSGDCILGEGTALIAPPDGDMGLYLESLDRLARMNVDRIYPGHWRPRDDGGELIRGYISHRKWREQIILDALSREPADVGDLVERAYSDAPPEVHGAAFHSALAHLELLEKQGRAVRAADGRWIKAS